MLRHRALRDAVLVKSLAASAPNSRIAAVTASRGHLFPMFRHHNAQHILVIQNRSLITFIRTQT
jgi:hypothetical protein